jgi:uncharacterized membrane protein YfhO
MHQLSTVTRYKLGGTIEDVIIRNFMLYYFAYGGAIFCGYYYLQRLLAKACRYASMDPSSLNSFPLCTT